VEIIVVDNASTDGSPEMVETLFPDVKVIRNKENLGFPKGNNIGVRAGKGRYVCLLNSDIRVFEDCFDALVGYMDQHQTVGMIGPKILNADLTHQSSCRNFPTLWNNFCLVTGLASAFRNSKIFSGEHMFYFKGDQLIEVDVLVGCFWMVRREAIDKFGLLDEEFFMYAEDLDWCKRCWKAGWSAVFFPEAKAIHYRGGSSAKQNPVWLALTQQNSVLRYWKKHHSAVGNFGIRCFMLVYRILRLGVATFNYLTRPAKRKDSEVRIQVAGACLRALFLGKNHVLDT
jgi:GT2 family glycosyltransferase